jgi:hypothetical protein
MTVPFVIVAVGLDAKQHPPIVRTTWKAANSRMIARSLIRYIFRVKLNTKLTYETGSFPMWHLLARNGYAQVQR